MVLDTGLEGKILTSAGDNAIRWRDGERLEDLFEDHCDELRRSGRDGDLAVDGPAGRLTYDELDAAANRVARFLVRGLRIQPDDEQAQAADGQYQVPAAAAQLSQRDLLVQRIVACYN